VLGVKDTNGELDGDLGPDDGDAALLEVADGDVPVQPLIVSTSATPATAMASR
jgi:hypothetical protein